VLLGTGTTANTFSGKIDYVTNGTSLATAVGDMNNDAKTDIVADE
jgi:hypothetical protein